MIRNHSECVPPPCSNGTYLQGSFPDNLRVYYIDVPSGNVKKGDVVDSSNWETLHNGWSFTEVPVWDQVPGTDCWRPILKPASSLPNIYGAVVDGITYVVREGTKLVLEGVEYTIRAGKILIEEYKKLPRPAQIALEAALLGVISQTAQQMWALYNIGLEAFKLACKNLGTRLAATNVAAAVTAAATLNAGPVVIAALGVTVPAVGVAVGITVAVTTATFFALELGCPLVAKHHPDDDDSNDDDDDNSDDDSTPKSESPNVRLLNKRSTPTSTPTPAPTPAPTPKPTPKPLPPLTLADILQAQKDVQSGKITDAEWREIGRRWDCQRGHTHRC